MYPPALGLIVRSYARINGRAPRASSPPALRWRRTIDTFKQTVPLWKKEVYERSEQGLGRARSPSLYEAMKLPRIATG
jgi:hypothetical protein